MLWPNSSRHHWNDTFVRVPILRCLNVLLFPKQSQSLTIFGRKPFTSRDDWELSRCRSRPRGPCNVNVGNEKCVKLCKYVVEEGCKSRRQAWEWNSLMAMSWKDEISTKMSIWKCSENSALASFLPSKRPKWLQIWKKKKVWRSYHS